jgi:hypothetical protein
MNGASQVKGKNNLMSRELQHINSCMDSYENSVPYPGNGALGCE